MSQEHSISQRQKDFLEKSQVIINNITREVNNIKMGLEWLENEKDLHDQDNLDNDKLSGKLTELYAEHNKLCDDYKDIDQDKIGLEEKKIKDLLAQIPGFRAALKQLTFAEKIERVEDEEAARQRVKRYSSNTSSSAIHSSRSAPAGSSWSLFNTLRISYGSERRVSMPNIRDVSGFFRTGNGSSSGTTKLSEEDSSRSTTSTSSTSNSAPTSPLNTRLPSIAPATSTAADFASSAGLEVEPKKSASPKIFSRRVNRASSKSNLFENPGPPNNPTPADNGTSAKKENSTYKKPGFPGHNDHPVIT